MKKIFFKVYSLLSRSNKKDNIMNQIKTIGITGASGTLGKELTKLFREKGYKVIGFTHSKTKYKVNNESPNEWITWECGKEINLKKHLKRIDILILNHGIYNKSSKNENFESSIEINALSKLKLFNLFEEIALSNKSRIKKEIWINTSEAEVLPALNPSYEISKLLIGQLVSFKKNLLNKNNNNKLKIKKIILGPFKSALNPIGIMRAQYVAKRIYDLSKSGKDLIIISPNPISHLIFPMKEFYIYLYCQLLIKTNLYL